MLYEIIMKYIHYIHIIVTLRILYIKLGNVMMVFITKTYGRIKFKSVGVFFVEVRSNIEGNLQKRNKCLLGTNYIHVYNSGGRYFSRKFQLEI